MLKPADILLEELGGRIQGIASGQISSKIICRKIFMDISREIAAYLESKSVITNWTALEERGKFDSHKIFRQIKKEWKKDLLPIYREGNSRRAADLKRAAIKKYMQLADSKEPYMERQLGSLVQQILDLIDTQIRNGYPAANMKEEHLQQLVDYLLLLAEEMKEIPDRISTLGERQEELGRELEKMKGSRPALTYAFYPMVDNMIIRTRLQQDFSGYFRQYRILQISGPSASGKSTFAKQYVYYYNDRHEKKAVYVEYSDRDRFDVLKEFIETQKGQIGLLIIDFVKGAAPERWKEEFLEYSESKRAPEDVQWMLFSQEAVFPELARMEYRVHGIYNRLHMVGVDMEEWKLLFERYGRFRIEEKALVKIYRSLSAGKPGGIYIKNARLLASLPEEAIWEAVEEQKQNITDTLEKDRFWELCGKFPEGALISCLLEPFSLRELEEIEAQGHWNAVIQELHQKGMLLEDGPGRYVVHETTRINMEQIISKAEAKRWHGRLAEYCREKGFLVECIMHLRKAGRKEEADELAKRLFRQGDFAGQILGYLKKYPLFSTEELISLLSEKGGPHYEAYSLLRERNNPEIAGRLLQILRENRDGWARQYSAAEWMAGLVLDCLPDKWFELLELGCEEKSDQKTYLLDYMYFACRRRIIPIDARIHWLMERMKRAQREERLLWLCKIVFQQSYYPEYKNAWKQVLAAKQESKEKEYCIKEIDLEEPAAVREILLCFECESQDGMKRDGRLFDEMTLRFILERQPELQPYCMERVETGRGELEDILTVESKDELAEALKKREDEELLWTNALLVLLCYHAPLAVKTVMEEAERAKQSNGDPFWMVAASCAWNISDWRSEINIGEALLDDEMILRMLRSDNRRIWLMAAALLQNRQVEGATAFLLQRLKEAEEEREIDILFCAALENNASSIELHPWLGEERYRIWGMILMEKECRLEAVPKLKETAIDQEEDWILRRQAVWCLTGLDGAAVREVAQDILWKQAVTEFDDSFDLEGHQIFVNMLKQGLWMLLDDNREENIRFLIKCYRSSRGEAWMTEEKAQTHVEWFYRNLELAGGVRNPEAAGRVMSKLCHPLVQAAVLRGLRENGDREYLEEVIANSPNRWMVLRAICEWCRICEADWTPPRHSFEGWELPDRILKEGAKRRPDRAESRQAETRERKYSPISLIGYKKAAEMLQAQTPFGEGQYLDWAHMTPEQREELHGRIAKIKEAALHQGTERQTGSQNHTVMLLEGSDYYITQERKGCREGQTPFLRSLRHLELQEEMRQNERIILLCINGEKQKVLEMFSQNRKLWYNELMDIKVEYALTRVLDEEFLPLLADWCVLSGKHLKIACHLMQHIAGTAFDNFLLHLLRLIINEGQKETDPDRRVDKEVLLSKSFRHLLEYPGFAKMAGAKRMVLGSLILLKDLFIGDELLDFVRDMPEAFVALHVLRFSNIEFRHFWSDRIEVCTEALRLQSRGIG